MAETTTMIARFDGDITGLQKANAKANQIVDGFAKNTATASKSVEKTTNRIGLGFKAIGGMIRSVTPFLDDATASMVYFGTMATDAIKNAFDAVSKFAGFLKGGLFLAAAAAAAGLGYYLGRVIAGTAATEKALAAIYRVTAGLKANREALKGIGDGWDSYTISIDKAKSSFALFGDVQEYNNSILEASKKQALLLYDSQQKLVSVYESQTRRLADLQGKMAEARAALVAFDAEYGRFGATNTILEGKLKTLSDQEATLRKEQEQRANIIQGMTKDLEALIIQINNAISAQNRMAAAKREAPTMQLPQIITDQIKGAMAAYDVLDARVDKSRLAMQNQMLDFVASLQPTIEAVGLQFTQLWTSFSQGFGDAVARAIVYGDDFGKAMQELGKQLLSTLISFLIQTVINTLLYGVLATLIQGGLAAGRIALQASIASAAAYAAAIETFGLFGFAAGPGLAAAAAAGTAAAAHTGFGIGRAATAGLGSMAVAGVGLAEGGLVTAPTLALVGESGDEAVVPLERIRELFGERGVTHINISLDDRVIAQAVVPWIPGIVHAKGVKGI